MQDLLTFIKKYQLKISIFSIVCVMVLGGLFLFQKGQKPKETVKPTLYSEIGEQREIVETSPSELTEKSYVDVKGAVINPGMYEAEKNARVLDVIEQAGGFIDEADRDRVNYAQIVEDQMVIYVPMKGEEISVEMFSPEPKEKEDSNKQKVNINTADANELQKLNGIGGKKAEQIIQYREANGSFQKVEDLTKVSGIGEKTLESLKEYITIK